LQIDPKSDMMITDDKNWVMSMSFYTADSLKAELHERGWRLTPQREIILDIFQNLAAGKHLSAEDLCELLHSEGHDIMARMGILRELELAEDHKHYEINQPYHHHHHLICVRCNQTIEFKNDSVLKIGDKTSKKEGYHLLDCQLTIHAVCPSCQRSILPV
jgi:Fur family transcriptional regulator, ferric uptake regulator